MTRVLVWVALATILATSAMGQATPTLYQRLSDGSCASVPLDTCVSCTDSFGTTYVYNCTVSGLTRLQCYRGSTCDSMSLSGSIPELKSCTELDICGFGYEQNFAVEFEVEANSHLTAQTGSSRHDSYLALSGQSAVGTGFVSSFLFASDAGDTVRYEATYNTTTYLTSAGFCAFGQTCSSGGISFSAQLVPVTNTTVVLLSGTRVELAGALPAALATAEAETTNSFAVEASQHLSLGSDGMEGVVIEASVNEMHTVFSNLAIGRLDSPDPVLSFSMQNAYGFSEYEKVTCEWNTADNESYVQCDFSNNIEHS